MSVATHCWVVDVVVVIILKPKALIDGIVAPIGWVRDRCQIGIARLECKMGTVTLMSRV
jgi:hypothetical protein